MSRAVNKNKADIECGGAVLDKGIRKGLPGDVTFEQRSAGRRGEPAGANIWEESMPAAGTARAEGVRGVPWSSTAASIAGEKKQGGTRGRRRS